ncbi:MAG: hypothetical protein ABI175_10455 [Polyangiales bacterium]
MSFPIGQEHAQDFLIGMFTAMVHEVYQRVAAESGLSMPFDASTKRRLFAQAILETTRSFPVSIRGRFEQAAEVLATEMAAGRPLTA